MVFKLGETRMPSFKKVLSAVAEASKRPAEGWRFLRQAVRELHVALDGITHIVAELEQRLERLEAAATGRPMPGEKPPATQHTATPQRKRQTTPRAAKKALKKTATKQSGRRRKLPANGS
ncbi:hypothetical protein [Solimonas marina]|uniref:Uncharacterized protein n=1 Tax=Solimonas marina TaxID=2714601 RepID=A0A969WC51_9GAMM|nr:hypothetical protein [Solimonas marina]NKF23479.1 hypothetical protein [Solimonas marina]